MPTDLGQAFSREPQELAPPRRTAQLVKLEPMSRVPSWVKEVLAQQEEQRASHIYILYVPTCHLQCFTSEYYSTAASAHGTASKVMLCKTWGLRKTKQSMPFPVPSAIEAG